MKSSQKEVLLLDRKDKQTLVNLVWQQRALKQLPEGWLYTVPGYMSRQKLIKKLTTARKNALKFSKSLKQTIEAIESAQ